jgi:glycerophosphoryl diester phosphodiesterase
MTRPPGHPYFAGAPLLFAHRGGAGLAPENTLEAFTSAVGTWGADIVETDVHLSRDGVLVVIHDETVDRTTDGSGRVADLTWEELQRLDAGYRFTDLQGEHSFRGRGVRIPCFEDLLDALPRTRINVDAKAREAARPLMELLHRRGEEDRVLFASEFDETQGRRLGYRGPVSATRRQITRFYLSHRLPRGGPYTPRTDALQVPWRWEGRQVTTARFIREAQRRNLPVHVWTVDDPGTMRRLLAWGADGIQTDRPDLLAQVFHEETGRPLPPGAISGRAPSSRAPGAGPAASPGSPSRRDAGPAPGAGPGGA